MQTVTTVAALHKNINIWKENKEKIVFIPTMGNLHAGHRALIDHANECGGEIICSIFINALQFDREEDLRAYPRTLQQDLEVLENSGVNVAFTPTHGEIYSEKNKMEIAVTKNPLNQELCGKFRPGFFNGVVEVITRLFSIIAPDIVIFGEKDYQQLIIVKQLVQDLGLSINIEQVSTQREEDGLALSSRNSYLNHAQRKLAPYLYAVLAELREQIVDGNSDFAKLEHQAAEKLLKLGFRPDYVAIRNGNNLGEVKYNTDFIVVLAAAWLGKVRLIDNVLLQTA